MKMTKIVIKELEDARIIRRIVAYFIDIIIVIVLPSVLGALYFPAGSLARDIHPFVVTAAFIIYQAVCTYREGQTAGSKFMKIKIISVNRSNIPFSRALLRGFALTGAVSPIKIDVLFLIGFIIASSVVLFYVDPKSKKRRHAWDLLSSTCVIKVLPEEGIEPSLCSSFSQASYNHRSSSKK